MTRIFTLGDLVKAGNEKKAVFCPSVPWCSDKPKPAAVILSQQARIVHGMIDRGLYIYEPGRRAR